MANLEQTKEKLTSLIRVLDRNLSIRSMEILPQLREIETEINEYLSEISQKKEVKQNNEEPKEEQKDITKTDDVATRAMDYLVSIKAKGIYNYKDNDKLIERAVKEWFIK